MFADGQNLEIKKFLIKQLEFTPRRRRKACATLISLLDRFFDHIVKISGENMGLPQWSIAYVKA